MKRAVILSLVAAVCVALEESGEDGAVSRVQLCGRKLSHVRAALCYGAEYVNKRSTIRNILSDFSPDEQGWPEGEEPWGGRRAALSARWSRSKRIISGLSDECCAKPCTTNEIMSYC